MSARKHEVPNELLSGLLAKYQKPEDLIGENGLLKQLTKLLVERALDAEMTEHLGHEKHEAVANAKSQAGQLAHRITVGSGRALVPFAKTDSYDDIACFDAGTDSSNTKVVMICSTSERSYFLHDFASWRLQAEKDAANFQAVAG